MKWIDLGGVKISPRVLIDSRCAVCANSGGGKSWLIRKILEGMLPNFPAIILDREGEFATLREAYDIVIVGPRGDIPCSLATAAKLARKLIELHVSAVIDLSDLALGDKQRFVKIFLEALIALPRSLWTPTLIVVDEAHQFAPETAKDAVSTNAVVALMDQGRKRGFGGLLATQRLAKLNKNALGEANNLFIGRFGQDIDLARASSILGFSGKTEWAAIKSSKPGSFYAIGPAMSHDGVQRFACGPVKTTHPSPTKRRSVRPPEPSKKILRVAGELADLKEQVEAEQSEVERLRARVKTLETEARARPKAAPPTASKVSAPPAKVVTVQADPRQLEHVRLTGRLEGRREMLSLFGDDVLRIHKKASDLLSGHQSQLKLGDDLARDAKHLATSIDRTRSATTAALEKHKAKAPPDPKPPKTLSNGRDHAPVVANSTASRSPRKTSLEGGPKRILAALAQHGRLGLAAIRMFATIGTQSTLTTYIQKLLSAGHIVRVERDFEITSAGRQEVGDVEPLPEGRELVDYWLDWVGVGGSRKILEAVLSRGSDGIPFDELAEATGITSMATLQTYVGKLRTAGLIETPKEDGVRIVRAIETLIWAAAA